MIVNLWRHRKFILTGSLRELRHRYAGSLMGVAWNVVHPLGQIAIFTLVFSKVMRIRLPEIQDAGLSYAVYLCAGLLPWSVFLETVTRCTGSFVNNASYLKKLPIAEQVFIARDAMSSYFGLLITMSLLVVVLVGIGWQPSPSWALLPLLLTLLGVFGFGIGLCLGTLNVYLRDVEQLLPLVLMLWFWSTPIVYLPDILPEGLRSLLVLNPMWYFIEPLQQVIVYKQWVEPREILLQLGFGVSFVLLGYLMLRRLRPELRDLL